MTNITIKDIEKLAELSRIRLTDEEKEKMLKDISSILGYVEQVQEVASAEDRTSKKEEVRNILRDDSQSHESVLHTEAILGNAPQREGQFVKVKKIL